jgi:hypothetical protein
MFEFLDTYGQIQAGERESEELGAWPEGQWPLAKRGQGDLRGGQPRRARAILEKLEKLEKQGRRESGNGLSVARGKAGTKGGPFIPSDTAFCGSSPS